MRIRVLFFAGIKDATATDEIEIDVPEDASVRDVRNHLGTRFPGALHHLDLCRFAVNEAFMADDAGLKDGDEVAVIPPVSGGLESRPFVR